MPGAAGVHGLDLAALPDATLDAIQKSVGHRVGVRVAGVRAIKNDIAVQSFTRFDSDLRTSLARQIYGDPRFVQYGQRSHPPIRILVDRGHVTLAGWVNSPVERAVLDNGLIWRSRAWVVDAYMDAYAETPDLGYIDMGVTSDLARAKELFPHARRNLLYTALTRAKRLCVLVGQRSALARAVNCVRR